MASILLLMSFLINPLGALMLFLLIFGKPSLHQKYVFFIGLLFGIIGYCMTPTREIDISRYWLQLDYIRDSAFSNAFNWNGDGLFIKNIFFWVISKANDNHLLPFFSMLIVYSSAGYIISKSVEGKENSFGLLLILELLLLPIYNIFSNVRNATSFAILSIAVFRDIYQNKRNCVTIMMYVIPCFIHMTGFVVVVFRLLTLFIKKIPHLGVWCMLGIPTAIMALAPRLRSIHLPGYIGLIFDRAVWKAYASMAGTSDYAQRTQEHGSFIANRALTFLFILAFYFLIQKYIEKNRNSRRETYAYYVEIVLMVTAIQCAMGVVKFWVFAYLMFIAAAPILSEYIVDSRHWKKQYFFFTIIGIVAAVMLFLLQLRSIYKNVDINSLMVNFMIDDYLVILFRMVKGFLYG